MKQFTINFYPRLVMGNTLSLSIEKASENAKKVCLTDLNINLHIEAVLYPITNKNESIYSSINFILESGF